MKYKSIKFKIKFWIFFGPRFGKKVDFYWPCISLRLSNIIIIFRIKFKIRIIKRKLAGIFMQIWLFIMKIYYFKKIKQLEKINAKLTKENSELKSKIIQVEKENSQLQQEAAELKEKDRLSDEKITKLQRIQKSSMKKIIMMKKSTFTHLELLSSLFLVVIFEISRLVTFSKARKPKFIHWILKRSDQYCWNYEPKDRPSFKMILDDLERNHYNLISLNKSEMKNGEIFVKQHKTKISQSGNISTKTTSKLPSLH